MLEDRGQPGSIFGLPDLSTTGCGKPLQRRHHLLGGHEIDRVGTKLRQALSRLLNVFNRHRAVPVLTIGEDHHELLLLCRNFPEQIVAGQHRLVQPGFVGDVFAVIRLVQKPTHFFRIAGLQDIDMQAAPIHRNGIILVKHDQ